MLGVLELKSERLWNLQISERECVGEGRSGSGWRWKMHGGGRCMEMNDGSGGRGGGRNGVATHFFSRLNKCGTS